MSEETPVLTEVRGPILIITLNRPEAKNAANLALSKGVAAAIDRLDGDDALGVGIVTGAGGTFCSGMDLKGFLKGERPSIPGRGFAGRGNPRSCRSREQDQDQAAAALYRADGGWCCDHHHALRAQGADRRALVAGLRLLRYLDPRQSKARLCAGEGHACKARSHGRRPGGTPLATRWFAAVQARGPASPRPSAGIRGLKLKGNSLQ